MYFPATHKTLFSPIPATPEPQISYILNDTGFTTEGKSRYLPGMISERYGTQFTHTHTHTHTHRHTHTHIYIYIYTTHTSTCTHSYTYAYAHTYSHCTRASTLFSMLYIQLAQICRYLGTTHTHIHTQHAAILVQSTHTHTWHTHSILHTPLHAPPFQHAAYPN